MMTTLGRWLDMDDEYPVVLADMPASIKGYVCKIGDDIVIVINARLSHEQQQIEYIHEVEHIQTGDIYRSGGADRLEIYAHRIGGGCCYGKKEKSRV
jgi:hypothetical protein